MPTKIFKKKRGAKNGGKNAEVGAGPGEEARWLVIVESPSKCAKIESYLGSQYGCISSKGHIRTINGIKAIDTKGTFEPTFTIMDEKKDHVEWMRKVIVNFDKNHIILASDDDREGEAIAWHICQVFGLPVETTPRIIFHEVTQPALKAAVASPTTINMALVKAQHARQVLDILVGYKISPYLWKYIFNSKAHSLSAGRCQTPALRLVYDNEDEKGENKLEIKYKTIGVFFSNHLEYHLNKEFETKDEVLDFLEKSKNFQHTLALQPAKESVRAPPKPLNTSRILQMSSNVLHASPKETMDLCQKLYQQGHITYMRTESSQYSPVFLEKAKEYVVREFGEKYLGDLSRVVNQDANNPHEAIRVTNLAVTQIPTTETRLGSMYRLIWKNTVESCMTDAVYNNIKTVINAPLELEYHYTVEIPVFLGWKKVGAKDGSDEQNNGVAVQLFLKSVKSGFSTERVDCTLTAKNKHSHYSEAGLIQKLEDLGIGRPSTFASIVETIVDRGYVKKTDVDGTVVQCDEYCLIGSAIETVTKERVFGNEKKKLVIQPIGILTVEFLLKTFDKLFSYDYTKNMEADLDLISSGREPDWAKICANCLKDIKSHSYKIRETTKQTYPIDDCHSLVFAPFGPIIRHVYKDENDEENTNFLQVNKDIRIDLDKAQKGEYTLDELLEIKSSCLGEYDGSPLYIKTGKYGPYVTWSKLGVEKRESIKSIPKPLNEITLQDVEKMLAGSLNKVDNNVLRRLNDHLSVRKGKFGPYVFYQRPNMKKPEFYNMKKFNQGFMTCEADDLIQWVQTTYGCPG
jgi:DNA topoisomerase-1